MPSPLYARKAKLASTFSAYGVPQVKTRMGLFDRSREKRDHDDAHVPAGTPGAAFDPVCRMGVDPRKAKAHSRHAGIDVRFCSVGCKTAFDKDPQKYLARMP